MFSNSWFRTKLAAGLVVVALLGVLAARRGDSINPPLWRCVAEPARWNGVRLWVPSARVLSVRETSFDIEAGDARVLVHGQAPAGPGALVSVLGTFHGDGPRLEMTRSRALPAHLRFRWLMEAVSVLVALGVLLNFARHFLFRPKILQVQRGD